MTTHEQLLADWRLTKKVSIQWTIVSTAGFFIFLVMFGWVFQAISGTAPDVTFTSGQGWDVLWSFGLLALLLIGFIVPHELIHGTMMTRYGGSPRYGIGIAYFVLPYVYAVSDTEYTRNQMIVILLAPLTVITLIGVGLMFVYPTIWLIIPLAGNVAGSVGDVWMALGLLSYSARVRVGETIEGVGVGVYGEETYRKTKSYTATGWNLLLGSAVMFTALVVVLLLATIGSSLVGIASLSIGDPNTFWHLLTVETDAHGLGVSVGFGLPLVLLLSGIGGVGYALLQRADLR